MNLRTKTQFFVALIIIATSSFAQLSGTAFLASQSNHAGIKVKFKANPGTAVTDSTLTDAAGNYSINIASGSYNISFSKAGFQTAYYNSNTAVILTNTVVLNAITLTQGNYVTLAGNVTGTLVNTNIYIVDGNAITVPTGSTLVIEPGTVIRFNQFHPFTVHGKLIAQGTANNKIIFTSNKAVPTDNDWVGIDLLYSNTSKITNCIIERANHGIHAMNCTPLIEYNEVRNFWYYGISMDEGQGVVRYNKVHDFYNNNQGFGIIAHTQNTIGNPPIVECNEVYNGGSGYPGIRTSYRCIVRNNYCHDITGSGIALGWVDSARVYNNVVKNCGVGIDLMGDGKVTNNTVFGNTIGIYLDGTQCTTKGVINNLVVNNFEGIHQSGSTPTPSVITNNLVWNNNTNYLSITLAGVGQTLTINSNGDPVDAYNNFSVDPNFVNGIPPYLNSSSHAYGAGDPMYSVNVGANTSLICSNIVMGVGQIQKELNFKVYPNPFSDQIRIEAIKDNMVIKLMDVLGKEMNVIAERISSDELKISTHDLSPGIYFLKASDASSASTIKLIKN